MKYEEMRPRAKVMIPFTELDIGMDIMVNFNMEEHDERGWSVADKRVFIGFARICFVFAGGKNRTQDFFRWYEAKVTGWKCTSSLKSLVVSVLARDTVPNCKIKFIDEVIIHPSVQLSSINFFNNHHR